MPAILPFRPNRLAYPGSSPGIDFSHIAMKGMQTAFSVVPNGANFFNYASAQAGTVANGTPTYSLYGSVGPNVYFGTSQWITFANQSTAKATVNMACIATFTSTSGFRPFFCNSTDSSKGIDYCILSGITVAFRNGDNVTLVASPATNVPYFIATSSYHPAAGAPISYSLNAVVVNLLTGQVFTKVASNTSGGPTAANGSFVLGTDATPNAVGAYIAAAFLGTSTGTSLLSIPELLQWAQDPWSFWYPQTVDFASSLAPSQGAAATPTWGLDQFDPFYAPQRRRRPAAILRGDEGIEAPYVFVAPAVTSWGWEPPAVQPPHIRKENRGAILRGDEGIESRLIQWLNTGWEIQPVQPPRYRAKTDGVMPKDDGIQFPEIIWLNYGWEVQPVQPPHPRPERSGAVAPKDDGIEAPYVFVGPPTTPPAGWEITPIQPPHPRPERSGAIEPRDEGIESRFIQWLNTGWEIQPVQPPHRAPERKYGAIVQKDDGTEFPLIPWLNTGWEIAPHQPRAFRASPAGIFTGDPGTQSGLIIRYNYGWEIPPPQPPHPRPERSGAIAPRDDGIENPFTPPPAVAPAGWEVQPFQPPHRRIERFGAIEPKDDGTQFPFVPWRNTGWEVQPVQPPHRAPERKGGALARFDEGIEITLTNWRNFGWEIQPVQPPHPRPERFGALEPKDEGIEAPYVFVVPPVAFAGWETDSFVRVRPRRFGAGALPTIFEIWPFFPPPGPPPIPPIPVGFGAIKVIAVDMVRFVYPARPFASPALPSIVNVGDSFCLLNGIGQAITLTADYTLFLTKPDGSTFFAVPPQLYLAEVNSFVRYGLFASETYTAIQIPGSFVDQHGYWSCYIKSHLFTSAVQKFYIGPPQVLT